MIAKKLFLSMAVFAAVCFCAFAKKTNIENLYRYRLSNGLEVFIAEDHDEPTVYINIAVKAGAVAQTCENAGLFHLYEHMMFKSNALYKSAEEMNRVMKNFGVTEDNATTDIDSVQYYFSLPSDKIEEGLAFWNAAIRSPTLDEAELEVEKKVVLSEIEGYAAEQDSWYTNYLEMTLFPKAPYKIDPSGSFEAVKNATVTQLREMQKTYYIPCNAALFLSGDVNPDEVMPLVNDIFGSWSNEGRLPPENLSALSKSPLEETKVAVFPSDSVSDNITAVNVYFRAPDTAFDIDECYTADYLDYLLSKDKYFKKSVEADKSFDLFPDGDISFSSDWNRLCSYFTFDLELKKPTQSIIDDALRFSDKIQNEILPRLANTKSFFSYEMKNKIYDECYEDMMFSYLASRQTIDILRSMWVLDSADFYFDYMGKFWDKATAGNMRRFVKKYFEDSKPLVVIFMSKANFSELESTIREQNVTVIEDDSYLWWKKPEFALSSEKKITTTQEGIYIPNNRYNFESKKVSLGDIEVSRLDNGIKVYFQNIEKESQKSVALQFVLKGGAQHLKRGDEALENAMFDFMSNSSKKYSSEKRERLEDKNGFSIDYEDDNLYSALTLSADDDSAFFSALGVFCDGIVNPVFDEKELFEMKEKIKQSYKSFVSDPDTLLALKVQSAVTEDSPYAQTNGAVSDDVDYISAESLKAHYERVMKKGDMFLVLVGQIDKEAALRALNKTIGKAKFAEGKGEYRLEPYEIKEAASVVLESKNALGTAFTRTVFPSPSFSGEDFEPACVAANVYSNVLYSIVREKYGACYGAGSDCFGSYMVEWGYKVSDRKNFSRYVKEAREAMLKGTWIEDYIEGAKITLERSLSKDWQYPSTKAQVIAQGVVFADDERCFEKRIERVRSVSADDVRRVFKKYWLDSPSRFFAVTGEGESESLSQ